MNQLNKIAFAFKIMLLAAGIQSCSGDPVETDLRSYYFPVDSLTTPRIYHYHEPGRDIHTYWEVSMDTQFGKTFLNTNFYYQQAGGPIQLIEKMKEEIKTDGAYLLEFSEYQADAAGNIFEAQADINSGCLFKWSTDTNEVAESKFKTTSAIDPSRVTLITKTRAYTGNKKEVKFDGKILEAAEFKDSFIFEYSSERDSPELLFLSRTSLYAYGIGMYSYVQEYENGHKDIYTLEEILIYAEWLDLLKRSGR